ncbi:MAG: vitamin B12 dependent-methionine synthase activation domain-containing protein, partial [Terriglobales bacterium]
HDIGKNLVDIILSNNGYRVVNLGIKQPADTIIAAAQKHQADAIGLSGLLVKSTVEMKYVLEDLERLKLTFPVICGGAALTRKYVEDDLRREYSSGVFYGEDAFAGLHLMDDLTATDGAREQRIADGQARKAFARAAVAVAEAPAQRSAAVRTDVDIPKPRFFGVRVEKNFDLNEVFRYINPTALFKNQWQLKTASQEDYARLVEQKYRPLLEKLQEEVATAGWFHPQAVYGWFPCQSSGNDVILYAPPLSEGHGSVGRAFRPGSRSDRAEAEGAGKGALAPEPRLSEIQRFTFPRQKEGRRLCISDFFAAQNSGRMDVIGLSVVTVGARASEESHKLFEAGEYTRYLYLHGLSVETAEALAELLHKRMREELGIAAADSPSIRDLFHQKYRGSRFSFGYPACPSLEDQTKIFALLDPEHTIGVRLTSGYQIEPEQSTSAIVVHHPEAKYFVA